VSVHPGPLDPDTPISERAPGWTNQIESWPGWLPSSESGLRARRGSFTTTIGSEFRRPSSGAVTAAP